MRRRPIAATSLGDRHLVVQPCKDGKLIGSSDLQDRIRGNRPAPLPRGTKMPKDELPDDLVEFLSSDRRLEYDASACEIGVFTFRTLEEVEEIDLAVSAEDHESACTIRALDLLKSCEEYDPRGILVYIPSLRKYGSYDSEEKSLITYRGMSWSDFLADPARYINAAWYLDREIAEATFSEAAADRVVEVYSAANGVEAHGLSRDLGGKGHPRGSRGRDSGRRGRRPAAGRSHRAADLGAGRRRRRAREIIEEWTSRRAETWCRPAESARLVEDECKTRPPRRRNWNRGVLARNRKRNWRTTGGGDTPLASDVRFGWLSPILLIARGSLHPGGRRLGGAYDWTTICKYPAAAEAVCSWIFV